MPSIPTFRPLVWRTTAWTVVAVLVATGLVQSEAQTRRTKTQRIPAATSDGSFTGTWVHIEPKSSMALRIRKSEDDSGWEIRYESRTQSGFHIDTNWQERHEYLYRGFPGFIVIEIDQKSSTDDKLVAQWRREQDGKRSSHLVETGTVKIYRFGYDGRALVWDQRDGERRVTVDEPMFPAEADTGTMPAQIVYQFEKQADRVLEWDEIYW